MNRAGKYASSENPDSLELLKIIYELTEKDRMIMWSEGYIDVVIEKLPDYAKDILLNKKEKWEDTKEFYKIKLKEITGTEEYKAAAAKTRKEFAMFVMEKYQPFQGLLFSQYDGNIKDSDLRKFVYRKRFGSKKKYLG